MRNHQCPANDAIKIDLSLAQYNFRNDPSLAQDTTQYNEKQLSELCLTQSAKQSESNWVNLWRLPESMSGQLDSKGQWPFFNMEDSPLRIELYESLSLLSQLKKFPIYLLDIWNQRIRQILGTVFRSLSPPTSNTLCHLIQLQQVDIVLQTLPER